MRKLIWLAAATVAIAGAGLAEAQDTPRKGGTIRMTAPYAASFASLDMHTTPRAQDEIVGKALHRTLYNWDSAEGKLVLELAKSVTSRRRRSHLYLQAARRRLFPQRPQDDGGRHHLVLHAHHGRQQGLSRRALRPHDQGRGRGREGRGQGDLRPEEDRRLHARDDADRARSIPATTSSPARPRSCPRRRSRRATSPPIRSAWARSSSWSMFPARASSPSAGRSSTSPASPTPTSVEVLIMAEAAGARRGVPQQGDRHLDPGPGAVRRLSRRSRALQGHPRSGRDVHPPHGHEPRASSRSRTSGCARRSTTPSTPT